MRLTTLALLLAAFLSACGGADSSEEISTEPVIQFQWTAAGKVAHGERLSRVLGCSGCHGNNLQGEDWSGPGFGTIWTANLTRVTPEYSDEQLAQIITSGARPDGSQLWEMPSHLFTELAPGDMSALLAYLRSIKPGGENHPRPKWEEGARSEMAAGTFKSSRVIVAEEVRLWPPETGSKHTLARYIVRATCAECHGLNLEGGQPHPSAVPRPDLRIVAAYEPSQFAKLMKTGIAAGNREVSLMSEVARGRYSNLTDEEINAIYDYLQALGTGE